jgi:hypothetical protein
MAPPGAIPYWLLIVKQSPRRFTAPHHHPAKLLIFKYIFPLITAAAASMIHKKRVTFNLWLNMTLFYGWGQDCTSMSLTARTGLQSGFFPGAILDAFVKSQFLSFRGAKRGEIALFFQRFLSAFEMTDQRFSSFLRNRHTYRLQTDKIRAHPLQNRGQSGVGGYCCNSHCPRSFRHAVL